MSRFTLFISALAVVVISGASFRALGQGNTVSATDPNDANIVRLVTTGQIRKLDAKKKTFEMKISFSNGPAARGSANRGQSTGTYPPMGGRRGGMGRRGGTGYPNQSQQSQNTTEELKVFVSDKTLIKDGDAAINFTTLKDGENITLTGAHRSTGKNDIDALAIARTTSGGY